MAPTDDQLLSHGTFLRRLAYALVRDEHEAEDVVQDTYLAALRKPPRGSALAWLTSTVRNLARRRVRDRRRRDQRERTAARRDVHAPTAEIVAQLELQRRVVAKLTKLEEPYREAIVLRFYYGQAPSQIARDHGLPVDTVKTRLRRGLQKLRAQLDAEHGGERRVWALSLMPMAIPGQASLAASHFGVLAMKLKLVWIAALLGGICVFLFWNAGGSGEPERRGLRANEPTGLSDSAAADATTGIEDRGPDTRSAPAAPGPTVLLEGTVILATGEGGEPVELEVRAESRQRELSEDRLRVSVRSGEGFRVDVGRFFADKLPFAVVVTARHPGYVAKTVRCQVMIDALDGRPVVDAC